MSDFRLWGRIEQIGPHEFVAIASAIPEEGESEHARAITKVAASLQDAQDALRAMLIEIGREVDARGDRVIDPAG